MVDRKRTLIHLDASPWSQWYQANWASDPSPGVLTQGAGNPTTSVQQTWSRGHAWPSAGQATTDLGGDFTTIGVKQVFVQNSEVVKTPRVAAWTYQGKQYAESPVTAITVALDAVKPSTDISLMQKGTTAIAKSIPTNPVADAGTFIGELKSGLPKLVGRELFKTKMKDYRKVGSEYLNVEFGWKPLISDLQKFGKAAIESEKILNQLHRDSGRNIRRKYAFPDERVVSSGKSNSRLAYCHGLSLYPSLYNSTTGGPLFVDIETTTKTWFSGCYTYHVNLGTTLPDRIARQAAEARKLFGVELTPETVWNLAPWSWAVDWEGNVGDVLHNVSRFAQDGLVMRYGYIMQHKTCKVTYTLHPNGSLKPVPKELRLTVIAESKVRRRATPFGFGFDMTALTGRQSAILGALGISRGPRHL